jgi:hypothetical protein
MYLQKGKVGVNCSIDFSKEEFLENFGKALALDKIDINDFYKEYRKEYNKLNPKVEEFLPKKKKNKNKEA